MRNILMIAFLLFFINCNAQELTDREVKFGKFMESKLKQNNELQPLAIKDWASYLKLFDQFLAIELVSDVLKMITGKTKQDEYYERIGRWYMDNLKEQDVPLVIPVETFEKIIR